MILLILSRTNFTFAADLPSTVSVSKLKTFLFLKSMSCFTAPVVSKGSVLNSDSAKFIFVVINDICFSIGPKSTVVVIVVFFLLMASIKTPIFVYNTLYFFCLFNISMLRVIICY